SPQPPILKVEPGYSNLSQRQIGEADIQLAGNEEGLFGIDPESGILYVSRPLDREKQAFYTLQVWHTPMQLVFNPVTITIAVKDENDNMPVLTEDTFSGILSKGTKQVQPPLGSASPLSTCKLLWDIS
uniref:Cadherin domain-containing protein n=1 Tax=Terrapene triunguis TaxID=2587831 RepID=A0A674KDX5_9SAUR